MYFLCVHGGGENAIASRRRRGKKKEKSTTIGPREKGKRKEFFFPDRAPPGGSRVVLGKGKKKSRLIQGGKKIRKGKKKGERPPPRRKVRSKNCENGTDPFQGGGERGQRGEEMVVFCPSLGEGKKGGKKKITGGPHFTRKTSNEKNGKKKVGPSASRGKSESGPSRKEEEKRFPKNKAGGQRGEGKGGRENSPPPRKNLKFFLSAKGEKEEGGKTGIERRTRGKKDSVRFTKEERRRRTPVFGGGERRKKRAKPWFYPENSMGREGENVTAFQSGKEKRGKTPRSRVGPASGPQTASEKETLKNLRKHRTRLWEGKRIVSKKGGRERDAAPPRFSEKKEKRCGGFTMSNAGGGEREREEGRRGRCRL